MLSSNCYALSNNFKVSIIQNLEVSLSKDSIYIWGAAGTEKNGKLEVDCSGLGYFITSAVRKAGIPIKRSVSERMSYGLDGWDSKEVNVNDAEEADMIFFTFSNTRPRGHVGYMKLHTKKQLLMIVHASSSRKRVAHEALNGDLLEHFVVIRRPTWGDKKQPILGRGVIKLK
jgi:hypothetical protein